MRILNKLKSHDQRNPCSANGFYIGPKRYQYSGCMVMIQF